MANAHIIKARFAGTRVDGAVRNVGLDVARGLCVLLVVAAHTNNILRPYLPVYKLIFPLGEMAQDLFFALSGYLVGSQILKLANTGISRAKALFGFYVKRWVRTLPFYLLFVAVNLVLLHQVYLPHGPVFLKQPVNAWPYIVFSQNLFTRHPAFFPEIWPIPIEEWSYLLLPLPFIMLADFFKTGNTFRKKLAILLFMILLVQTFRMIYIFTQHPETDWELRKIVIYRMDALLYGFLMALFIKESGFSGHLKLYRHRFLCAGLFLLGISLFFHKILTGDGYNALLFIYQPLACALLLPFFIYTDFRANALTALLTHFSLTGYAVLLSHLYCLQFLTLTFFQPTGLLSASVITLAYLVVLALFSVLFYNFVERPILLLRKT